MNFTVGFLHVFLCLLCALLAQEKVNKRFCSQREKKPNSEVFPNGSKLNKVRDTGASASCSSWTRGMCSIPLVCLEWTLNSSLWFTTLHNQTLGDSKYREEQTRSLPWRQHGAYWWQPGSNTKRVCKCVCMSMYVFGVCGCLEAFKMKSGNILICPAEGLPSDTDWLISYPDPSLIRNLFVELSAPYPSMGVGKKNFA